jgi:hypothetical protein
MNETKKTSVFPNKGKNNMKQKLTKSEVKEINHIIQTAADYLQHPDVASLRFAIPSVNIAHALREVIGRLKDAV